MPSPERRTLVICVGNERLADHAAGLEVYRRLAPLDARLRYCELGTGDLLPLLDGEAELFVVEAINLGAAPGTVHVIPWHALPKEGNRLSGTALREALEIGKVLCPEQVPSRVTLVGIEGRRFDRSSDRMTSEVADAIDTAVATVRELVLMGCRD